MRVNRLANLLPLVPSALVALSTIKAREAGRGHSLTDRRWTASADDCSGAANVQLRGSLPCPLHLLTFQQMSFLLSRP
jgi:hypothetical protein